MLYRRFPSEGKHSITEIEVLCSDMALISLERRYGKVTLQYSQLVR